MSNAQLYITPKNREMLRRAQKIISVEAGYELGLNQALAVVLLEWGSAGGRSRKGVVGK